MNNKNLKVHIKRLIDDITDLALDALVPEESEEKDDSVHTTTTDPSTEPVQGSTQNKQN